MALNPLTIYFMVVAMIGSIVFMKKEYFTEIWYGDILRTYPIFVTIHEKFEDSEYEYTDRARKVMIKKNAGKEEEYLVLLKNKKAEIPLASKSIRMRGNMKYSNNFRPSIHLYHVPGTTDYVPLQIDADTVEKEAKANIITLDFKTFWLRKSRDIRDRTTFMSLREWAEAGMIVILALGIIMLIYIFKQQVFEPSMALQATQRDALLALGNWLKNSTCVA